MKKSFLIACLVLCFVLVFCLSCNLDSSKGVFHNVVLSQEYSETKVHPFLCRLVDESDMSQEYYYYDYFFVSDDGIQVFNDKSKAVGNVLTNRELSENFFVYDNEYIKYNQVIREAAINKIYDSSTKKYKLYVLCLTGNGDLISGEIAKQTDGTYKFIPEHMSWPSLNENEDSVKYYDTSMPDTETIYKSSEGKYYYNRITELTPGGFFICSLIETEGNGDDFPDISTNNYYNRLYYWSHDNGTANETLLSSTDRFLDYNTGTLDYLAEDPVGEKTSLVLAGSSKNCMYIYEGTGRGDSAKLSKVIDDDKIVLKEGLIGFKYMGSLDADEYGTDKFDIFNYALLQMTYSSSTYYYTLYRYDMSNEVKASIVLSNKPNRYYMQNPMIRYKYGDTTDTDILSIKGYESFNDYEWTETEVLSFGSVTSAYKTELNETDIVNIRPVTFLHDEEQRFSFGEKYKFYPAEFVVATDDNFLYVLYYYSYGTGGQIVKNDVPQVLTISMYNE